MPTIELPTPGVLPQRWWAPAVLLAETPDETPAWATTIERAIAVADRTAVPGPPGAGGGALGFAPALAPLVDAAVEDLDVPATGIPRAVAVAALRASLRGRLARTAARTLALELSAARERGELTAADPRDRFQQFLSGVATRNGLAALATGYPVLARLLGQICVQETQAITELATRFTVDRGAVVEEILDGVDPGEATVVTVGAGDRHAGGRTVAVLTFAAGARIVYKPRPVTLHHHFAEMLAVIEAAVPGLAPRAPHVHAGDGYGWMEFVPHRACTTERDVARFYRRLGAMLALLYALDATDAHCENLIACGDHPVLVDVETLLHPTLLGSDRASADPAMRFLAASVHRTAMLPRPVLGELGSLDLSALGGGGAIAPDPGVVWAHEGTDRMQLVRGPVRYDSGESAPTLLGAPVDPRRHGAELIDGFRMACDVIRAGAATLFAPEGPITRCADAPVRLVLRDTATYVRLLDESTHPSLLRVADERNALLESVLTEDPPAPALVGHELADLWSGDVPLFTARPDGHDVRSTGGHVVRGVLGEQVLDRVRHKITGMDVTDLERQEWMIRTTLALDDAPVGHVPGAGVRRAGCIPAEPSRMLAAACAVGDQLVALAEHDDDRANWVGVQRIDGRFWSVLPLGGGLGDGFAGVALFLAQLGAVTGIPRYTTLARRASTPLRWLVPLLVDPPRAAAVGCGAFAGLGGITYALARLSTLLSDAELAGLLPTAVAATVSAAGGGADEPGGADLSVESGLAGGVLALHAVCAESGVGGSAAAELADLLTHRAASGIRAGTDGGVLQGRAGVDWALRRAGLPGLPGPADLAPEAGAAWCCGTAGRLAAILDGGTTPSAQLVAAASAGPPLSGHSLCHGEAGVLDALVTLGGGDPDRLLRNRAAQLLAAVVDDGLRCDSPQGLPTPGLLGGLAGVGYALLRLARPDQVPSVLLLRPTPDRIGPDVRSPDSEPSRPVTLEE